MYKLISALTISILSLGCSKSNSFPTNTKVITKTDTVTTVTSITDSLAPQPVVKTNTQKVYAHYLPWFETPATSPDGKWGQHWTMANENPDIITNGKRQIASYFYPMTGPYASSD